MAAAIAALSDSICPAMGINTLLSASVTAVSLSPFPSFPIIIAHFSSNCTPETDSPP